MRDAEVLRLFEGVQRGHRRCFWLDGGGSTDWSGRRSVLGWLAEDDVSLSFDAGSRTVTRHVGGRHEVVGDDVFAVLADEVARSPADARWVGYLGYASRRDLPATTGSAPAVPDAVWMRPHAVRVVRHRTAPRGGGASKVPSATPVVAEEEYRRAFAAVQEEIRAGNTYETNLTYRVPLRSDEPPLDVYRRLRVRNPAPYAAYLQHDVPGAQVRLLSSSPERFVTLGADRTLETRPIKGTMPRGATPEEDQRLRTELASAAKFRAENLMVVDLLRNDLSVVCRPGSVEVPALMAVESYATVHQLVSTVRGTLRSEVGAVEAVRALFPPGSMTGAPKRRTMEIISRVEATPRGAYAGALGWLSATGADLGVVIRSLVTDGSGHWSLGTGGGVTADSLADDELAETAWKASALLDALG